MTDLVLLTASAKTTLLEIAKQAGALGSGLQNVAPGDKNGTPNNSVQYLLTASESLAQLAIECEALISESSDVKQNKP